MCIFCISSANHLILGDNASTRVAIERMKSAIREVELDLGRYELRRTGRPVKVEKKPMELLIFLVSRREQLVTRKDIVTKLWRSDLFIDTEPNINNIVRKIRTALGDDPAKPRFLETVVGKGYRFIGPVRVIDARHPRPAPDKVRRGSNRYERRPDERSSLAVLPLVLLGNITDDQGLSLGFADALVTRLGNLQGVDVLPTSAVLNVPAGAPPSDIALRLVFALLSTVRMRSCPKGNGNFQWKCLIRICRLVLCIESATSTYNCFRNWKTKLLSRLQSR